MDNFTTVSKKEFKKWKRRVKNEELVKDLKHERHLKDGTYSNYIDALTNYCLYHKKTMQELFDEADEEEEQGIRIKKRKIYKKLIRFRSDLIEKEYEKSTIIAKLDKVKTFYSHHGIEIPKLPPAKIEPKEQEMFYDLPQLEHIKQAFEATTALNNKAVFLFCASSGTGRAETAEITVKDFIKATEKYHEGETDIYKVIQKLEKRREKGIIPLFELKRVKTGYKYYTCCSPETTDAIIAYLKSKKQINPNDTLFGLTRSGIGQAFKRVNGRLYWGKVGNYNFFGPHKVRKFNASALEDEGLVNAIQGRKRNAIYEAYFKTNPESIRDEYEKHLDKIMINNIELYKVSDEVYEKVENDLNEKVKTIDKLSSDVKKLQELVKSMQNPDRIYLDSELIKEIFKYAKANDKELSVEIKKLILDKIDKDYPNITENGIDKREIEKLFNYAENTLKLNPEHFTKEQIDKLKEKEEKNENSIKFQINTIKNVMEDVKNKKIELTPQQTNKLREQIHIYAQEVSRFESEKIDKKYIKILIRKIINNEKIEDYISPNRFR